MFLDFQSHNNSAPIRIFSATAVLTKGEFAIEKAIFLRCKDLAFITLIVTNFYLPRQQQLAWLDLSIIFNANSNFCITLSFKDRFWPFQ